MDAKTTPQGVIIASEFTYSTEGTPQGGVISPLLANIYLHHVLDEWVVTVVGQRLKGRYILVRYADDLVMAFEVLFDAQRVFRVLGQRLNRFGLTLHPDKSRFIDFRFRRPGGQHHPATNGTTFDFLGFTHLWSRSLKGKNVVRQVTAKGRFACPLSAVTEWCQRNRHQSIRQHLSAMLRGHYGYYGITGNGRRIRWYLHQVVRVWKKWLSRRGRHGNFGWDRPPPDRRQRLTNPSDQGGAPRSTKAKAKTQRCRRRRKPHRRDPQPRCQSA